MLRKIFVLIALAFFIVAPFSLSFAATEEEDTAGWITDVSGSAYVTRGSGERLIAKEGVEVFAGDEILTSADSSATIQLEDDSVVTVGEKGRLLVSSLTYDEDGKKNASYFKLFSGRVRGLLNNLFGGNSEMAFETPTSVAGVRGSDISVWIEGDETVAAVNEGTGYVKNTDKRFPGMTALKAGKMLRTKRNAPLGKLTDITPEVKEKILKLKINRKNSLVKGLRKGKLKRLKESGKDSPKEKKFKEEKKAEDKKEVKKKEGKLSEEDKKKRKEILEELKKRKKSNPYN